MITVKKRNPSFSDPLERITFLDTEGDILRQEFIEQNGGLVLSIMYEYDGKKSLISRNIFTGITPILIAFQIYDRSDNSSFRIEDYKVEGGAYKKISSMVGVYEDQNFQSKSIWYDANGREVYSAVLVDGRINYSDAEGNLIEYISDFLKTSFPGYQTFESIFDDLLNKARS
ncbi:hypothetical protein [Acinetobacter modestus]|uniref:hypothetical protein n=1 Tax=Acinetobacter modestus TaxID=1776740 RepID=UPI003207DDBD